MVKWFLCQNEDVEGPFETEEIKQRLESGELDQNWLIWGRPQEEWKSLNWWTGNLSELLNARVGSKNEQVWHYVHDEISYGPLKRHELVEAVKDISDKSNVYVWTSGMTEWMPLFENNELIEEIGISRRKHPRADIDGTVAIEVNGQSQIGQLKMISAGGCGVSGIHGLKTGMSVHVTLKSSHFYKHLNAIAQVRYVSDTGFAGLEFSSINMEEKAAIIDYVRDKIVKKALAA